MVDPELEPGPRWAGSPPSAEKPFQVTVRAAELTQLPRQEEIEFEEEEVPLSLEEIEAAYLAALETAELVDHAVTEAVSGAVTESPDEEPLDDSGEIELADPEHGSAELQLENDISESEPESALIQPKHFTTEEHSASAGELKELPAHDESNSDAEDRLSAQEEVPIQEDSPPGKAASAERSPDYLAADDDEERPITTREVVEALLFVGGEPLPTKKILDLVGGSLKTEQLENILAEMNATYLNEGRPYEVRLQTGGYVLSLREEFESVRSRAFGQGPKEVKLAQDALEVLALVAYQQPATREALEEMGRPNLSPILRQLLRRQLICLERHEGEAEAQYRTTPRFLSLFGLQSLDDLPQAGDFNFK